MATGQCARVVKYYLIGFNLLILLACAAAIGVGVWALVSDYGAEEMDAITGSDLYLGGAIVIIVGAVIVAVISFLGCLGAFKENSILLGIYFVIMLLFLILFIVVAALGFFFKDDVEDELAEKMEETLLNDYVNGGSVQDAWDFVQEELHCCGVRGGIDSDKSWFLWQQSSWFTQSNQDAYVPKSCCNEDGGFSLTECQQINADKTQPIQTYSNNLTEINPALYHTGCISELKDKIEDHAIAIGIIAVIVLIIMIACIFSAAYLCMEARRYDGEKV